MREKIAEIVKQGIFEVTNCADLKCGDLILSVILTDALEALFTAETAAMREALQEARGCVQDMVYEFDDHEDKVILAKIDTALKGGK